MRPRDRGGARVSKVSFLSAVASEDCVSIGKSKLKPRLTKISISTPELAAPNNFFRAGIKLSLENQRRAGKRPQRPQKCLRRG